MATRRKAEKLNVPQSRGAAEMLMTDLGDLDGRIRKQLDEDQTAINDIKQKSNVLLFALRAEGKNIALQLKAYFEANRDDLLKKGQKSVNWGTGQMGHRFNPVSVSFKKADLEDIVSWLEKLGFNECVKVIKTVLKTPLLSRRDDLPDDFPVKFAQAEYFFVIPAEQKEEHLVKITGQKVKEVA